MLASIALKNTLINELFLISYYFCTFDIVWSMRLTINFCGVRMIWKKNLRFRKTLCLVSYFRSTKTNNEIKINIKVKYFLDSQFIFPPQPRCRLPPIADPWCNGVMFTVICKFLPCAPISGQFYFCYCVFYFLIWTNFLFG